ncbi:hypothetical protein [Cellulomonas marina]|uniref:Uncharacterized protein n=1 Tax=Cellulomonas marina TaxID=988821 RepID=A0A1I0V7J1_9CELL|nr:hypothetical protein [Cellulomonas marina]GIG28386.1 hypothetical protein Cma02nite_09860 [Cellulomonas marina]SFA72295.1 hypothetical protein SAMN05421867_101218 [Cellulomonas marina]
MHPEQLIALARAEHAERVARSQVARLRQEQVRRQAAARAAERRTADEAGAGLDHDELARFLAEHAGSAPATAGLARL